MEQLFMSITGKGKQIPEQSMLKAFINFLGSDFKERLLQLNIKMAVKVTVGALISLYACVLIERYLRHPDYLAPGLWCVVSTVIVLQANIGGLYKASWIRFVGVLIGSMTGALVAFLFGAGFWALGLAFFTTILLCSFFRVPDSYRMASLSVAIIMIPWKMHSTTDPWIDAFFRFLDTCLGLVVAILVSHILWPSQALTKMRLNMAETFNLFRQFFEQLLIPPDTLNKIEKNPQTLSEEIEQAFTKTLITFEDSKVELFMRFSSTEKWFDLINYQNSLWESLHALQNSFNPAIEEVFDEGLRQQVQHIVEVIDFVLKELSIKLKTGKTSFDFDILDRLQNFLHQELIRFRSTRKIKEYSLDIVEDYFVFFYQLKLILKVLYQFNQMLDRFEDMDESKSRDLHSSTI